MIDTAHCDYVGCNKVAVGLIENVRTVPGFRGTNVPYCSEHNPEGGLLMEVYYGQWGRHGTVDMIPAWVGVQADRRGWHWGNNEMGRGVAVEFHNGYQLVWLEDEWEWRDRCWPKCPEHRISDCSPLLNGCSWSPDE